jgi:hypothetical protein
MKAIIPGAGRSGRGDIPVEVIKTTPKKYQVRLLQSGQIPGGKFKLKGQTAMVAKNAVMLLEEPKAAPEQIQLHLFG